MYDNYINNKSLTNHNYLLNNFILLLFLLNLINYVIRIYYYKFYLNKNLFT
jgi:hypothetical protein